MKFFFRNFVQHTVSADIDTIKEIPFIINKDDEINAIVKSIIKKQKQNPRYNYANNEQLEIDKLVYWMYGLDEDDIQEVKNWYVRRYPRLARQE